jgi:hypothetical protein
MVWESGCVLKELMYMVKSVSFKNGSDVNQRVENSPLVIPHDRVQTIHVGESCSEFVAVCSNGILIFN